MAKKTTTLTIEEELITKAKQKFLNISEIAEDALREKLKIQRMEIAEPENYECEFCHRSMEKATKENLDGLSWLYPDEKWICPKCLRDKGAIL